MPLSVQWVCLEDSGGSVNYTQSLEKRGGSGEREGRFGLTGINPGGFRGVFGKPVSVGTVQIESFVGSWFGPRGGGWR